jgi:hypothetical protein
MKVFVDKPHLVRHMKVRAHKSKIFYQVIKIKLPNDTDFSIKNTC